MHSTFTFTTFYRTQNSEVIVSINVKVKSLEQTGSLFDRWATCPKLWPVCTQFEPAFLFCSFQRDQYCVQVLKFVSAI